MSNARWICIPAFLWLGFCPPLRPQDQKAAGQTEQPTNALVVVERSGGYAAVQEKFEVYLDGKVINAAGLKRKVSASRLDSLLRNITALDAATPPRIDLRNKQWLCFDCFRYRITVFSPEGRTIIIDMDELEMGADTKISALTRSVRDLVFGLKWD